MIAVHFTRTPLPCGRHNLLVAVLDIACGRRQIVDTFPAVVDVGPGGLEICVTAPLFRLDRTPFNRDRDGSFLDVAGNRIALFAQV